MTRAFVVGRQRKGRKVEQLVIEVEGRLRAAGWDVDGAVVKRKRDLRRSTRDAADAGYDVVVAVGGDGAVLQVATALAETETQLGIVPAGTGNLLAGNLDIPKRPKDAVEAIVSGRRRRIDLGRVNVGGKERSFTVACGIGFDAEVMEATKRDQKLRWGKLAYLASAVGQAGAVNNAPHEITIDGVKATMDAAQVFVANFGKMLPFIEPRRQIRGDDGLLDVIVVRASGPFPGLVAGWEAMLNTDLGESSSGRVYRTHAREIEVSSDPARRVEIDGSVIGMTPIRVSVQPKALTVIVPRR